MNRYRKFTKVNVSVVRIDQIKTLISANQEEERKNFEKIFKFFLFILNNTHFLIFFLLTVITQKCFNWVHPIDIIRNYIFSYLQKLLIAIRYERMGACFPYPNWSIDFFCPPYTLLTWVPKLV